ncbi:MAG: hypothetical protein PW734_12690 [Verrucomicrobium sp.]|nr:hypothetical protein [Verrucomicrobium sp.]
MKKGFLTFSLAFGIAWAALAADTNAPVAPAPDPNSAAFLLRGDARHLPPEVRSRLLELLGLPKDKLWEELHNWPAFQQMNLQQQAGFLNRLSELRQRSRAQALKKAAELNLPLSPEQEDAFVRAYLAERSALEKKFSAETKTIRQRLETEANRHLTEQFGKKN